MKKLLRHKTNFGILEGFFKDEEHIGWRLRGKFFGELNSSAL